MPIKLLILTLGRRRPSVFLCGCRMSRRRRLRLAELLLLARDGHHDTARHNELLLLLLLARNHKLLRSERHAVLHSRHRSVHTTLLRHKARPCPLTGRYQDHT